jgi:hypothetical protein|tara:strand:+ start:18358 stop:19212 length:855 start_codon:yes stop_codon:yes gene_type:complete
MSEIKFELPNRKVKVRYIRRNRGMASNVDANHVISGGMLSGSTKKFCTPLSRQGTIKNVLTTEEKDFLEELMGIELSVYKNTDFWSTRRVSLVKGDNDFDLSNPVEYIDYKILLGNSDKIAQGLENANNDLNYMFVIIEEGEEVKVKRNNFSAKKKAFKLYSKIEDSQETLRSIVKLVENKAISKTADIEWLRGQVESIIENKPEQFVSLVEDVNYGIKMLISNAEDAGVVIRKNKRYSTLDGLDLCREGEIATFENAVTYLANPLNQEVVDLLEAKTKKATKA